MERPGGEALVHLVNLSGYTGSNFHAPIPMRGITISVKGNYVSAHVRATDERPGVRHSDGYTTFLLPALGDYEVVVLE
jgi:hypothetical protein